MHGARCLGTSRASEQVGDRFQVSIELFLLFLFLFTSGEYRLNRLELLSTHTSFMYALPHYSLAFLITYHGAWDICLRLG